MSSVSAEKQPLLGDEESTRNIQSMNNGGDGRPSKLTVLGFGFLTFNSVMAIYRSGRDTGTVTFVVVSYLDLVLLFACLRLFDRAPPDSASFITISAFAGLVGVLFSTPRISAAAADAVDGAASVVIFLLFAAAVLGMFVMTVSKMVPGIINP